MGTTAELFAQAGVSAVGIGLLVLGGWLSDAVLNGHGPANHEEGGDVTWELEARQRMSDRIREAEEYRRTVRTPRRERRPVRHRVGYALIRAGLRLLGPRPAAGMG